MPAKLYPTNTFEQARKIFSVWDQIDAAVVFGDLDIASFKAEIEQAAAFAPQISSLEAQLTNLRNQRDARLISLWGKIKRVRSGIKSHYGDDSSQYEMAGGTRLSERKPYARKTKAG